MGMEWCVVCLLQSLQNPPDLMKPTAILAALCAAGLLTGFSVRRVGVGGKVIPHKSATVPTKRTDAAVSAPMEIPVARSTDTLESMREADPGSEYARIAAWLAGAAEEEIAAYWEQYKSGPRTGSVTDLIFIAWTRCDPQAATAAVAGTEDERYAWWAWAASDPAAALAAARTPLQKAQAACGIGDFQPDWLRAHFQEIPEEFRTGAIARMQNWPVGQDPRSTLEFLRANDLPPDGGIFANLVKTNPWAAVDWLKENESPSAGDPFAGGGGATMETLISTLAIDHPEVLERLAAETPPGADKRAMDQALFDKLLAADPAAALEKARATEVPLVAAGMLGKIGLGLLATDPDKAFGIAAEIVAANPGQIDITRRIAYPDGESRTFNQNEAVKLLMALYDRDRGRTMDMLAVPPKAGRAPSQNFSAYAQKWAEDDLAGFSEWAGRQSGAVLENSATQIGSKLSTQGRFPEAIEWAGASQADPGTAYSGVLYNWQNLDPEAAAAWVENSDLTEPQKAGYREKLSRYRR